MSCNSVYVRLACLAFGLSVFSAAVAGRPPRRKPTTAEQAAQPVLPPLPPDAPPMPWPPTSDRLRQLAEAKGPVTVIAFGDSITFGQGVSDVTGEQYAALWTHALRRWLGEDRVRLINLGDPGAQAWYATQFIESHLAVSKPDLVVLQFGGNDSREKVGLGSFTWSLAQMISRLRASCEADIVLAVPPMLDSTTDGQIIDALWRLGKRYGVTVADFNQALKSAPGDFRGPFPQGGHPNAYSHRLMALALHEACAPLWGLDRKAHLALSEQTAVVLPDDRVTISALLSSTGEAEATAPLEVQVSAPFELSEQREVTFSPEQPAASEFQLTLPPPVARSMQSRVWACATPPGDLTFDQRWLTLAPIVACPTIAEAEGHYQVLELGQANIALGREECLTPADLSAEVEFIQTTEAVQIGLRIHDDQLVRGYHVEQPENDCVELYFDLRPEAEQGRLYYTRDVFCLFIEPPTPAQPTPNAVPLSGVPKKAAGFTVTGRLEDDGYSLLVQVPLAAFATANGGRLPRFGFDVVLDDSDRPGWRQTQMVWAGYRQNYLDPSRFGVVQLAGPVVEGARRLTLR